MFTVSSRDIDVWVSDKFIYLFIHLLPIVSQIDVDPRPEISGWAGSGRGFSIASRVGLGSRFFDLPDIPGYERMHDQRALTISNDW